MNKIILAIIGFFMAIGMAFAAVDLNSANEQELDAIKGIGPVKAKAIVDERKKNGPFKNLDDVQARVKGIGPATVAAWKKDGSASVGGASATPAKADAKADTKADTKADKKAAAKADSKADAKADMKADKKADDKKAAKKDEKKDAPKADAKADAKAEAKTDKK
jgi:competence ComEA-like helix-hairpin-helix protein